MTSDLEIEFKKDKGLKTLIQKEKNQVLIDPSEVTLKDLIVMFGEESVRRGLQYMSSLKEADEEFKKSGSKEAMLEALKEMTGEDEPTEGMKELSDNWSEEMENQGLGLD